MSHKKLIMEGLDRMKVTKVAIFDFDGTLVDTPTPDVGMPIWKDKTGTDWPHKGWWSKRESLDMNVFEMVELPFVIKDYHRVKSEAGVHMVIMTGRIVPLGKQVKAILDEKGLVFDEYLYNNKSDTLQFKIHELSQFMDKFPNLEVIEAWDDRDEHIPHFEEWGAVMTRVMEAKGRKFKFIMHHVLGDHHGQTI